MFIGSPTLPLMVQELRDSIDFTLVLLKHNHIFPLNLFAKSKLIHWPVSDLGNALPKKN